MTSFIHLRIPKAVLTATRFAKFPVSADHLLLPQEKVLFFLHW